MVSKKEKQTQLTEVLKKKKKSASPKVKLTDQPGVVVSRARRQKKDTILITEREVVEERWENTESSYYQVQGRGQVQGFTGKHEKAGVVKDPPIETGGHDQGLLIGDPLQGRGQGPSLFRDQPKKTRLRLLHDAHQEKRRQAFLNDPQLENIGQDPGLVPPQGQAGQVQGAAAGPAAAVPHQREGEGEWHTSLNGEDHEKDVYCVRRERINGRLVWVAHMTPLPSEPLVTSQIEVTCKYFPCSKSTCKSQEKYNNVNVLVAAIQLSITYLFLH